MYYIKSAVKVSGSIAGSTVKTVAKAPGSFIDTVAGTVSDVVSTNPLPYEFEDLVVTPFKERRGCKVTLYQDAHCEGFRPQLVDDSGGRREHIPHNCFEEIYAAILNAKRFVYITGWSVDTKISLVRQQPIFSEEGWPVPSGMMTIGELLKYKAAQGIRVMLHVWDEALSVNIGGVQTAGVMATFDEETKAYFEGTGVICKLSYRLGVDKNNQFLWTHHQKSVIVDATALPRVVPYTDDSEKMQENFEEELFGDCTHLHSSEADYSIPDRDGHTYSLALFMTCEHQFEKIWGDDTVSFFRPLPPDGIFIGGDIAERTSEDHPTPFTRVFVVAEPPVHADHPPVLAPPVDFELAYPSEDKLAKCKFSIWKPIPPPNYVSLGMVVSPGPEKPDIPNLRCVHETAVEHGHALPEEDHRPLWTKGRELLVWRIAPQTDGLDMGYFDISLEDKRPTDCFYTVRIPPLGVDAVEKPEYHHPSLQKTSIHQVPCDWGNVGRRRVIAFVGGLDLTYGRWDTPEHPMWKTLGREHAADFNHGWVLSSKYGPREGWHDIHGKFEGPIARDVMINFEQRWKKQARGYPLYHLGPEFISPKEEEINEADSWTCRLLRSIDPFSADIHQIENCIQQAYIHRIREAKRFLYMENQYFLGSSKYWRKEKNVVCHNLVPYEIAQRICKGIQEKEWFMAYILLPLYPEGYPSDGAIQEILRWQNYTMCMMYTMIAYSLKNAKLDKEFEPTDFLNFYFIGKREALDHSTALHAQRPPSGRARERTIWTTRRFPIYVHSKMLLIDDDYVMMGSANINERSLAGNRDSEICVESWQPKYRGQEKPRGDVHDFRMSIWAEHTGVSEPEFLEPNTIECVKKLAEIGERNWEQFTSETITDMTSHLMPYPIVYKDERVVGRVKYFPDTKAPVVGTSSISMPDLLTT